MCARLIDRIMGSSRPKHDKVSLMDSQKATGFSILDAGTGGRGLWTGGADADDTRAGGEVRAGASAIGTFERSVVTGCKAGSAEAGVMVATTVDSFSNFLS
jgi:hypothetical protein